MWQHKLFLSLLAAEPNGSILISTITGLCVTLWISRGVLWFTGKRQYCFCIFPNIFLWLYVSLWVGWMVILILLVLKIEFLLEYYFLFWKNYRLTANQVFSPLFLPYYAGHCHERYHTTSTEGELQWCLHCFWINGHWSSSDYTVKPTFDRWSLSGWHNISLLHLRYYV